MNLLDFTLFIDQWIDQLNLNKWFEEKNILLLFLDDYMLQKILLEETFPYIDILKTPLYEGEMPLLGQFLPPTVLLRQEFFLTPFWNPRNPRQPLSICVFNTVLGGPMVWFKVYRWCSIMARRWCCKPESPWFNFGLCHEFIGWLQASSSVSCLAAFCNMVIVRPVSTAWDNM